MSDPKRATLITVGATKSGKNNVKKTVRLNISLDESNERKYPELNYKELVIVEEKNKRVENGKTAGLDPFSDDDDVVRVAKKFEQKYGGNSTYGRKGRSKVDEFADIGAGYDESDSFIDNTHGYDEMIPPECDTLYGGFYINCGSLEFKTVSEIVPAAVNSDGDQNRRNKRRISSSSSEECSDSSSESEGNHKEVRVANGGTEHRKKKNKNIDKKKAKKVRRTDSSAATSGKQTSDDNVHGDAESADSRTSQSSSLASKPAPSSENAITSDSSRDIDTKSTIEPPSNVVQVLETLEASLTEQSSDQQNMQPKELINKSEQHLIRLQRTLTKMNASESVYKAAFTRAAKALKVTRSKLIQHVKSMDAADMAQELQTPSTQIQMQPPTSNINKTKDQYEIEEDFTNISTEEREAKIVDTLQRLKALIDERKPDMIANYNAECERVQEERKKIQIASADGAPVVEKRLPKRRFPWCPRTRALLSMLRKLAVPGEAHILLSTRALPLFPSGFVRMPTLLRQADLSKDVKGSEIKRQRLTSASQPMPTVPTPTPFTEPQLQFPSSLTVTATVKTHSEKSEVTIGTDEVNYKASPPAAASVFDNILINPFTLSKDLIIEKESKEEKKDEIYIPPNNIGSITITPVPSNQMKTDKRNTDKLGLIRVKSPATLNEMIKKDKYKKKKNHTKEKKVDSALHIDTNHHVNKEPNKTKDEIPQKQIEKMRVAENNIPKPALVPVHHSPTFAKPDKRPPEVKKKKDLVIVSDVDPLSDGQEPVAIDDSSSDVELVEERTDKSDTFDKSAKSEVPCKDKVKNDKPEKSEKESIQDEVDAVFRNIKEMEHSQEPKFNSNSFRGVINNAKHEKSSSGSYPRGSIFGEHANTDKLTNFFEENGWM